MSARAASSIEGAVVNHGSWAPAAVSSRLSVPTRSPLITGVPAGQVEPMTRPRYAGQAEGVQHALVSTYPADIVIHKMSFVQVRLAARLAGKKGKAPLTSSSTSRSRRKQATRTRSWTVSERAASAHLGSGQLTTTSPAEDQGGGGREGARDEAVPYCHEHDAGRRDIHLGRGELSGVSWDANRH